MELRKFTEENHQFKTKEDSYKVVRKQCLTVKKTETICTQKMSKCNI